MKKGRRDGGISRKKTGKKELRKGVGSHGRMTGILRGGAVGKKVWETCWEGKKFTDQDNGTMISHENNQIAYSEKMPLLRRRPGHF